MAMKSFAGLRIKLFLPLIFFSLLVVWYAHFHWLPQFFSLLEQNNTYELNAHLNSIAENLVPSLLDNQLAAVSENLDALLQKNSQWISLQLFDIQGNLLYPFNPPSADLYTEHIYAIRQPVSYLGHHLGSLVLVVDSSQDMEAVRRLQRKFMWALFTLIAIFLAGVALSLEWIVRRPLNQLSTASNMLARGYFSTALPKRRSDEVGRLVESFASMRNAIQHSQQELKREISNHKRTAQKLYREKERVSYQASHDALTGLANRRELELRLSNALHMAKQTGTEHTLLYLDLDQFKIVNDTCGHIAGDELLRQLAVILEHSIRKGDTLARIGGDEFGVLLENCTRDEAVRIAGSLREAVQEFRFAWGDNMFGVGVSIGVVQISADSESLTQVLSTADTACYTAKDMGRNRIQVYKPGDTELARRHGEMQWVSHINKAIDDDRFELYCQPIVPAKNHFGGSEHLEILLRMTDSRGELIPPGAFIPAAERYNLMAQIDRWVVSRVFATLLAHPDFMRDNPHTYFAINISGSSLSDEKFLNFVGDQFRGCNIPPQCICFEITETAAIADLSNARNFIATLKKLGCKFSLDDFGSGLSSFAYLKNLPVDFLKIDGLFVKDIASDPIDFAMVKSINEVGHIMGMKTIAEFVENNQVMNKLKSINVDYAQGYGIEKPFPLRDYFTRVNLSSGTH